MIFLRTNNFEAGGKEQKETSAKEDIFAGQMLLHLYLHDGNYGYEITTLVIKTFEITAKQTYDIVKKLVMKLVFTDTNAYEVTSKK